MRIAVLGLGYVGCISAACFAELNNEVIGVDPNPLKVEIINQGRSPIVEPGIEALIQSTVKAGRLRATTGASEAISNSEISLVCVGTPSNQNGSLDLRFIKRACQEIGEALEASKNYHVVAFRSTMLPGTLEETIKPALEVYSGKRAGKDFGVAVNPEFLREGTSIVDFHNPPFTLVGCDNEEATAMLRRLYAAIKAPFLTLSVREAEMVKYACNSFHGLKVTFANELGIICKRLGIDSHRVMEVFCKDTKLNLSPYYLKPGFAFGGSCLPKDLRAITYKAKQLDLDLPLINSILPSNRLQVERVVEMVLETGCKSAVVVGMSFKSGTDDLRESPTVTLIESLLGKGMKLSIYDPEVEMARIFGANKEYIEQRIPHLSALMSSDLNEVLKRSEVVIVAKKEPGLLESLDSRHLVIDLVRLSDARVSGNGYQGLCW